MGNVHGHSHGGEACDGHGHSHGGGSPSLTPIVGVEKDESETAPPVPSSRDKEDESSGKVEAEEGKDAVKKEIRPMKRLDYIQLMDTVIQKLQIAYAPLDAAFEKGELSAKDRYHAAEKAASVADREARAEFGVSDEVVHKSQAKWGNDPEVAKRGAVIAQFMAPPMEKNAKVPEGMNKPKFIKLIKKQAKTEDEYILAKIKEFKEEGLTGEQLAQATMTCLNNMRTELSLTMKERLGLTLGQMTACFSKWANDSNLRKLMFEIQERQQHTVKMALQEEAEEL